MACTCDIISLKSYIDDQIGHERQLRQTSEEADVKATAVALTELNRRLGDMNRFREENLHDRGKYLATDTYNARHDTLIAQINAAVARIDIVEKQLIQIQGQSEGVHSSWMTIGTVITFLISGAAILLNAVRIFTSGK